MRHWATGDRPLRDYHAFFEIHDRNVAVTSYNVPHSDVQSFARRLDCNACWITTWHLNAAHQFGRFCINYVDRSTARYVVVSATIGYIQASLKGFQGARFEHLNGGVIQMCSRIIRPVISSPIRIAISREWDSLGYLVRCPADGYKTAVFQIYPDFIGIGKVDGLFGTRREPRLVHGLARPQVHND